MRAFEPDFHGEREVELYNLVTEPLKLSHIPNTEQESVRLLTNMVETHIVKRERVPRIRCCLMLKSGSTTEGPLPSLEQS